MKRGKVLLVSLGLIISSGGLVHAFDIPGVTRPFDPANYYSPTSISYPDSTYTPFTMKDLAANGYQVKDVTRGTKNSLSDLKTYLELLFGTQNIQNMIIDLTGLSSGQTNSLSSLLQKMSAQTQQINQSGILEDQDAQKIFQTVKTVGDPTKTFNRTEQIGFLDPIFKKLLEATKDNIADTNQQIEALKVATDASATAGGSMAATQADTEVQSLQSEANLRRNALLSNYVVLNNAKSMSDRAEELQSAQDMKNGMAVIISDPYHLTEQEQKQYVRPTGIGFVKFQ